MGTQIHVDRRSHEAGCLNQRQAGSLKHHYRKENIRTSNLVIDMCATHFLAYFCLSYTVKKYIPIPSFFSFQSCNIWATILAHAVCNACLSTDGRIRRQLRLELA